MKNINEEAAGVVEKVPDAPLRHRTRRLRPQELEKEPRQPLASMDGLRGGARA